MQSPVTEKVIGNIQLLLVLLAVVSSIDLRVVLLFILWFLSDCENNDEDYFGDESFYAVDPTALLLTNDNKQNK